MWPKPDIPVQIWYGTSKVLWKLLVQAVFRTRSAHLSPLMRTAKTRKTAFRETSLQKNDRSQITNLGPQFFSHETSGRCIVVDIFTKPSKLAAIPIWAVLRACATRTWASDISFWLITADSFKEARPHMGACFVIQFVSNRACPTLFGHKYLHYTQLACASVNIVLFTP